MKTIYFYSIILFTVLLTSSNLPKMDNTKELIDIDRFYSALSKEKGMNYAFLAMFDTNGVMLTAKKRPIVGIIAIENQLLARNDSTFILTWEPEFAKIADSGELGYTYGLYQIIEKSSGNKIEEGTYTTIWQKNQNGKWKAVLDTGNEGLK
ncbi:MAG: YybH family protein [Paludibacter sp.]